MKKLVFIFSLWLIPLCTPWAANDVYQFNSAQQKERFQLLTTQLRCLVCQNQNLAESNAGLATDLRNQVYQKIQAGQSDSDIIQYLVERYGNFILYKPPINVYTIALWFSPFLLLLAGIGYLIRYIKKNNGCV
jgi:cytochrome c-type biogenesis protein CcmH